MDTLDPNPPNVIYGNYSHCDYYVLCHSDFHVYLLVDKSVPIFYCNSPHGMKINIVQPAVVAVGEGG